MAIAGPNIDLDNKFWNADTVSAVVAAKKDKRNLKNKAVNLFVLQDLNQENNVEEVKEFFAALKQSIDDGNFPHGGRFQIAAQSGAHWTALDVTIKDNKLHVISIDHAFTPSEQRHIDVIFENFPDTQIYAFDGVDKPIQFDNNSCSRFTLDTLFKLENLDDPVAMMEAAVETHKPRNFKNNKNPAAGGLEHRLSPQHFPPEMAFVFRNTQSGTAIDALPDHIKHAPVNKMGVSLLEHAEKGAEMVQKEDGSSKKLFKVIETVKQEMSDYTNTFLHTKGPDEIQAIASDNRKGLDYISAPEANRLQSDQTQKQAYAPDKKMEKIASDFSKHHQITGGNAFTSFFNSLKRQQKDASHASKMSGKLAQGQEPTPKELNKLGNISPDLQEVVQEFKSSKQKQSDSDSTSTKRKLR